MSKPDPMGKAIARLMCDVLKRKGQHAPAPAPQPKGGN